MAAESVVNLLRRHAERQPDSLAYIMFSPTRRREDSLSFAALHRRAAALAGELVSHAAPGDRVLLICPNGLDFVVGFFACLMAGLIAVPVAPPRRHTLRDAGASVIADCAPRLALVAAELIDGGRTDPSPRLTAAGVPILPLDQTAYDRPLLTGLPTGNPIAFLQYTSGSTAAPKGVMVSQANVLANLEMIRLGCGNHAGSVHACWLPLHHDMGLIFHMLEAMYLGTLCVLMTPVGFLHRPLDWLRAIHRFGAEVAAAPNFAFDLCVERFRPEVMEGVDLSGWKIAGNGAEPVRADTMRRFAATFAPYGFDPRAVYPAYGLAEATILVSSGHRGRGCVTHPASAKGLQSGRLGAPVTPADTRELVGCGLAVSGVAIAIVDPATGERLPAGQVGEIWLRGPSVAQGYWDRPVETAETFGASLPGEAGTWLRTGDLGCLDEAGELFVVGRIKDTIILRGANHYPQDIEATAGASHPALRRHGSAAFRVAGTNDEDQLVIVQEVEPRHRDVTARDLVQAIRAALANEHDIAARHIVLAERGAIPLTTSGKLRRAETARLWREGRLDIWAEAPGVS
jgi:acyl-CoA synthetase (AMP-forming)/AMP-acid ligase II